MRKANTSLRGAMGAARAGALKSRGRGRPSGGMVHRASPVAVEVSLAFTSSTASIKGKRGRPRKTVSSPEIVIEREDDSDDAIVDSDTDLNVNLTPPVSFRPDTLKRTRSEADLSDDNITPTFQEPARKKATARKSTTPRIATCKVPPEIDFYKDIMQSVKHMCTLQCSGLEGLPPNLQCSDCMCLFHPACVNYTGGSLRFTCQLCSKNKPVTPTQTCIIATPSIRPTQFMKTPLAKSLITVVKPVGENSVFRVMPKHPISNVTLNANTNTLGALRSILDKRQPNVPNFSLMTTTSNTVRLPTSLAPTSSPVTVIRVNAASPGMPRFLSTASGLVPLRPMMSHVTSNISPIISTPPSLVRPAPPLILSRPPPPLLSKPGLPTSIPPPKLVIAPGVTLPLPKTMRATDAPLNAQLLTLPEAVTRKLKLSQPVALKINDIQIIVPPSCVIKSDDGLKVLLPPNTFPVPSDPSVKLNVTVSNNLNEDYIVGDFSKVTVRKGIAAADTVVAKTAASKMCVTRRQKALDLSCSIRLLYGGFDCMLEIFKHLRVKALLRCGMVCRTWKLISSQPCLWKRTRLRQTCITDWEAATIYFKKVGVETLSLQGMYRGRTWTDMMANLHHLRGLKGIEFGHVSVSVLDRLCEQLTGLEVLKAEYITDYTKGAESRDDPCKINLGKFVSLSQLRELRLRSTHGLTLPSFSFNEGLSELSSLKNLQVLSLTSLKSLPDNEFHFLREMKQIHTLDIGSCATWSSETYFILGSLTNLTRLRLEWGGEIPDIGLSDALFNLTRLEDLQLVHYTIADSLYPSIEALPALRSLTVWPEATDMAAINTNTLTLVSKLQKLDSLEWGAIIVEQSTEYSSDMDRRSKWISFYPPDYQDFLKECSNAAPVPVNKLSLIQLTESLANNLPNTDIKVKKIKVQTIDA